MNKNDSAGDSVIRTLLAVGSDREARLYTKIFRELKPEQFAFLVLDPRVLRNPLLEAFSSILKILAELKLTPIIKIGALQNDKTNVSAQTLRLCRALEMAGIRYRKLNCATYQLIGDIRKFARLGNMVLVEDTGLGGSKSLAYLVNALEPQKIVFLQPSGGLTKKGKRIPVINIDDKAAIPPKSSMSAGQLRALTLATSIMQDSKHHITSVIVSPLNLLAELFTIKGSGTMLRRAARVKCTKTVAKRGRPKLKTSIETAFERKLKPDFLSRKFTNVCLEQNLRGGAMVSELAGLSYLSKFWVIPEAQGEGIAGDIWQALLDCAPVLFWRSRHDNPFNDWYMQKCDGMQKSGDWRVFWIGLHAPEIPGAVIAASSAPQDFE